MHFPHHDPYWLEVWHQFRGRARPKDILFAPNEFLEFHAATYPLNYLFSPLFPEPDWVIDHKDWEKELRPEVVEKLHATHRAVWQNPVFHLFERYPPRNRLNPPAPARHSPLHSGSAFQDPRKNTAIVVTTYNRPWALERSLPKLLPLGVPILVVNDGSDPHHSADYQRVYRQNKGDHLSILELPTNRGLACAHNIGISHWLARPGMEWISCFQDDVEADPGILDALALVRHPVERPILSGFASPCHPTLRKETLAGREIHHRHSNSGLHIEAHRSYWERVMPIPSRMLGAPKIGLGSDEDWWIISWSPRSIVKQGGTLVCLPGLILNFGMGPELSTWGNSGQ